MRIALFTEVFLPKIDGITNRLRNTILQLHRLGHEVLVFAPDGTVSEYDGARVVQVPSVAFARYAGLRAGLPDPRLVRELRRFEPQVVHAVGPVCLGVWGILAARALRLPLVASYHTDLPGYAPEYGLGWLQPALWPLIRRIHNAAEVNLCPSRHSRDELRSHGVESLDLWRGGVDAQHFHPSKRCVAMRARLCDGRPDGPILLYVGRLAAEKRLASLGALLDAVPEARLALVGDGPVRASLERHFAGRRVCFTGFLRGEELAAAYASADVFVMPSTTETLGFVVLEAMSSGCPVVAARAGGIPDAVTHGHDGLLFDPAQPGGAAAAVRQLLAVPGVRSGFATRARKSAESCAWPDETRKLVNQYRKAIVLHQRRGTLARVWRAIVS